MRSTRLGFVFAVYVHIRWTKLSLCYTCNKVFKIQCAINWCSFNKIVFWLVSFWDCMPEFHCHQHKLSNKTFTTIKFPFEIIHTVIDNFIEKFAVFFVIFGMNECVCCKWAEKVEKKWTDIDEFFFQYKISLGLTIYINFHANAYWLGMKMGQSSLWLSTGSIHKHLRNKWSSGRNYRWINIKLIYGKIDCQFFFLSIEIIWMNFWTLFVNWTEMNVIFNVWC